MKIFIFSFLIMTVLSCNSGYKKADDAQDAGRQFIRASLDGDIAKANFYLLKDTTNLSLMNKWKTVTEIIKAKPTVKEYFMSILSFVCTT